MKRLLGCLIAGALVLCGGRPAQAADPTPEQLEFFEKKIRPVLAESCYSCHSVKAKENKKLKGKFYADSFEGLTKGGNSEKPGIVPGKPDESMLIKAIQYKFTGDDEDYNMPPKKKDGTGGKLPDAVIKDFEKWVKDVLPTRRSSTRPRPRPMLEMLIPRQAPHRRVLAAESWPAAHWAFVKPTLPTLPAVKTAGGVLNGIDAFVKAKLEAKAITPNAAADRRTLIRRATFALTGVPPTPEDVDAFVNDKAPNAWEKVVDRLLASPKYGEAWGRRLAGRGPIRRHQGLRLSGRAEVSLRLHVPRLGDPLDQCGRAVRPVSGEANRGRPASGQGRASDKTDLAAMGFLTLGRRFLNNQADIIDDRIDVVSRGTMALTVSCARCHDHKFDPIPIKDYYSLYGVFSSSTEPKDLPQIAEPDASPASLAFEKELKARQAAVEEFLAGKSKEILGQVRTAKGIGDYLMAAANPPKDAGNDSAASELNRYMVTRWREYLGRGAQSKETVFAALAHVRGDSSGGVRREGAEGDRTVGREEQAGGGTSAGGRGDSSRSRRSPLRRWRRFMES